MEPDLLERDRRETDPAQVRNNVFAECRTAITFSPWGEKRWREYTARTLEPGGIDTALYLSRYPDLAKLAEDHDVNFIRNNVVYNGCTSGEWA